MLKRSFKPLVNEMYPSSFLPLFKMNKVYDFFVPEILLGESVHKPIAGILNLLLKQ